VLRGMRLCANRPGGWLGGHSPCTGHQRTEGPGPGASPNRYTPASQCEGRSGRRWSGGSRGLIVARSVRRGAPYGGSYAVFSVAHGAPRRWKLAQNKWMDGCTYPSRKVLTAVWAAAGRVAAQREQLSG
jgi:hypothetical protein